MNCRCFFIVLSLTAFALPNALLRAENTDNWPCFRGPTRQGNVAGASLPESWGETENIRWNTEVPGEGHSSPIAWGDRIFLTTAHDGGVACHVLCLNAETGAVLWDTEVFRQEVARKEGRNSYATSTPATDGKFVYAVFGSGSIAALDFEGAVKWTFREFTFYSRHGLGASPVLEDGLLILPWDWSQNPKDGEERVGWQIPWDKSFVFALDAETGKLKWKTGRGQSRISHISPNVWTDPSGRKQLISGAGDVMQGFDLKSGELLWTGESKGEGVVPSVLIAGDLAIGANGWGGSESVRAYRMTGAKGDVSASHLAWEQKKNSPRIPSMVHVPPYVYAVTEGGLAWCAQENTGELVWRERLDGTFSASPIATKDRIYVTSDAGETVVLATGAEMKVINRNQIGEPVQASPAVLGNRLLLRSNRHLFCIGL